MKKIATLIFCVLAWASPWALAATDITHNALGYFVPEKRIRLEANVGDPRGIKLARTYFKFGPQADYLLVPMEAAGTGRYTALLPAPSPATDSIEYLFLAVNNDGQVARTDEYTVKVRRTGETPAWQNVRSDGQIKVFTEVAEAPMPAAAFSDSVTMDLVESGARFGAVAGLASGSSGAAGGSAASTGSTTATTTATTASVGGLSTAAIVGGVVIAGAAVAAAASSGGGGGGSSSPSSNSFAGSWSGTWSTTSRYTDGTPNGTCSGTWTGTVDSQGNFSSSMTEVSGNECFGGSFPISGAIASSGAFSTPLPNCLPVSNRNLSTGAWVGNFSTSPSRTVSGTLSCPAFSTSAGVTGNWAGHSP